MFEAVLVALADHGFTPTAIAARLTYLSAPDSLQGALAAGLLGGGSRFLGVTEDCGTLPARGPRSAAGDLPTDDAGWDALALDGGHRRPGPPGGSSPASGHPVHKDGDPRTPVLIGIAEEEGLRGPHLRLFEAIGRVHEQVLGRTLPLNGAGVCGAALADLGLPRGAAARVRAAGPGGRAARAARRGAAAPGRQRRLPRPSTSTTGPVDPDPLLARHSHETRREGTPMQLVTEDNITELAASGGAPPTTRARRELLTALVRHLHDFAREVRLTEAEWMAAIQWLNAHRADQRREARGVHPRLRRPRACRCSSSR